MSAIKTLLFGKKITPACAYCEYGKTSKDERKIMCHHNGIVAPDFSCMHFNYSPLKRKPKKILNLPEYNAEDFKL